MRSNLVDYRTVFILPGLEQFGVGKQALWNQQTPYLDECQPHSFYKGLP